MQLVLNTRGLSLKVKNRVFRVSAGEEVRDISPELVDSIAVTSPCVLSSAAVRLAAEADIPIYFFNRYGDADACLRSPYFESLATLRRKQVYFSDRKEGAAWVVRQFELKTEGQIANLKYLKNRRAAHAVELTDTIVDLEERASTLRKEHIVLPTSKWSASIMGWEGNSAKNYWRAVALAVPEEWTFAGRSRRPARDAFNALVNYFYGMLYALTERALFDAGLDPHLGILHADEYDRPTLSFDLIEPFRPWVDEFLLRRIFTGASTPDVVAAKEEGYWVSSDAKATLIPAFNEWMETNKRWDGRRMSRVGHIFRAAAELAKLIDLTMQRPS